MIMQNETTENHLYLHEWLAVLSLLLILLLLTVLAMRQPPIPDLDVASENAHYMCSPKIEIAIEGAVEYPGTYVIKRNATLQEALDLAKPFPEANLSKFKKQSKLRDGRVIKVPYKKGKKKTKGELRDESK
jgi:hypothetical protein